MDSTMNLHTKAELGAVIDSIAKRGKKLDQDIHVAACSAIAIKGEAGDTMFINRLYLALSAGARKVALTDWLLVYGGVVANDGSSGKPKNEQPFLHTKEKAVRLEEGMADPWYDHKPDPKPDEVFDIMAAVNAILKKAKGKELQHAELLAPLAALVEAGALSSSTENAGSMTKGLPEGESDEDSTDPRSAGIDVARGTIDGVPVAPAVHLMHAREPQTAAVSH